MGQMILLSTIVSCVTGRASTRLTLLQKSTTSLATAVHRFRSSYELAFYSPSFNAKFAITSAFQFRAGSWMASRPLSS